nr:hypothetical protein [Tanacetum cinerariifolium]
VMKDHDVVNVVPEERVCDGGSVRVAEPST